MTRRRLCKAFAALVAVAAVTTVTTDATFAAAVQPPPAQEEFVPLEQVPPGDQLPAAPLLVAAYALIWIAVLGYLWSIWRRMAMVERELDKLAQRTQD